MGPIPHMGIGPHPSNIHSHTVGTILYLKPMQCQPHLTTLALIFCLISGNWLYFKFSDVAPEKGSFNITFHSGLHQFVMEKTCKILIFPLPLSSHSVLPASSHCFLLLSTLRVTGLTIYLILSFQSLKAVFTS